MRDKWIYLPIYVVYLSFFVSLAHWEHEIDQKYTLIYKRN